MLLMLLTLLSLLPGCRSDEEARSHALISDAIERSEEIVAILEAHPGDEEAVMRAFGELRQRDPDAILRYRKEQQTLWAQLEPRDRAHFQERIEAISPTLEKALSVFTEEAQQRLTHEIATIN